MPLVVMAGDRVWQVDAEAYAAGVSPGLRRGGVLALLPAVDFRERDEMLERRALDSLALALLRFTPRVALADDACVLADVSASLRLFGGVGALCRALGRTARMAGHRPRLGVAPTATAAWLLARSDSTHRHVATLADLPGQLDALPAHLLAGAAPYLDWLDQVGCATLGILRRLPRAGLARRCGAALPDELARAYGEQPETPCWYEAPMRFDARIELPARTDRIDTLLFAARRLLVQLGGWLAARHLAVGRYVLIFEHEPAGRCAVAPTAVTVRLASPAASPEHLLALLKEHLARHHLAAPVLQMHLRVAQAVPCEPGTASLLPEPGQARQDFVRLVERLRARLGESRIVQMMPRSDHRPEVASTLRIYASAAEMSRSEDAAPLGESPVGQARPAWLVDPPQPLAVWHDKPVHGGPLQLLAGPERIEAGWWDGRAATRDYFIAADPRGALLWVFRERQTHGAQGGWYLHGLFG